MMDLSERRRLEASGLIPYRAAVVEPCSDGPLVTVAFGQAVVVHPHPSGVPGLPPLVLRGGDTLHLPEQEAERLYNKRVVLHPVTGSEKPSDPPPRPHTPGVTIAYGNGPRRSTEQATHLSIRDYQDPERKALEKYDRELAAEKAAHPERYAHGDREGRLPVRIDTSWGALPPGSWPRPPDVGW